MTTGADAGHDLFPVRKCTCLMRDGVRLSIVSLYKHIRLAVLPPFRYRNLSLLPPPCCFNTPDS